MAMFFEIGSPAEIDPRWIPALLKHSAIPSSSQSGVCASPDCMR
jgi:hypothetical protein